MTVEERRAADPFPEGLRVLAVDDDSTCLRLLETMLRRCKYHVTTTNQAVEALRLLRESKDKFDLVISDVHMPDMDGFKLLELVGLEMDLPVIMLSGNSDPKAVMKGITHGACDYLVKPVRMEELRNIWQHVVRRRRLDVKDRGGCDDPDMARNAGSGQTQVLSGSSDRNGRPGRKRKDQSEDDDEDFDDIGHDNEDSSAQKKPRVVWTVDLHRKFVAAVNQLGMDKAMPKRILDLMNVEKLTRENVASHLQKYRQYLKRIRQVASQQASMVAALGGKDNPFLSIGSLDGVRSCSPFPVSRQPATLASFQQGSMLGRLNSANNQAFFGLGSSGMIQLGRAHGTASNTISDMSKFPQISFSGAAQQVGFVQGMPMPPLDPNQLQQQQQKLLMETSGGVLGGSSNPKLAAIGNSNNSFLPSAANGLQLLQAQSQQPDGFGCPPPARVAAISADPFDTGTTTASSNPPDISRCNEAWGPPSAPLAGYMPNTLQQGVNFSRENGLVSRSSSGLSSIVPSTTSRTTIGSSSTNPIVVRDLQCHGNNGFDSSTTLAPSDETDLFGIPDIGGACSSVQRWDNQPDPALQQSFQYTSSNSLLDMVNNSVGFKGGIPTRMPGDTRTNQSNANASYLLPNQNIERLGSSDPQRQNEYGFEPATVNAAFDSSAYSSNAFDELMSAIVKRERDEILMDGDISCDLFSLETCM